jgi:hypothetical protein
MGEDATEDDLIDVLLLRVRRKNGESEEVGDVTATISICPLFLVGVDTWVILGAFSNGKGEIKPTAHIRPVVFKISLSPRYGPSQK